MVICRVGYTHLLFLLLLGCVSTHLVNTTNAVIKLDFEHPGLLPGHAADLIDIICGGGFPAGFTNTNVL